MSRSDRTRTRTGLAWALAILLWPVAAPAEDRFGIVSVRDLTVTEGRLPGGEIARGAQRRAWPAPEREARPYRQPRAVLDGAGEVYLAPRADVQPPAGDARIRPAFRSIPLLDGLYADDVVAVRVPAGTDEVRGRLFVPAEDRGSMVAVAFRAAIPPAGAAGDLGDPRAAFGRARRRHYERCLALGLPGGAWFRHQAREADALLPPAEAGPGPAALMVQGLPRRVDSDVGRTYALFSGGRAIAENLQLDRPLTPGRPLPDAEAPVPIGELVGITVPEIDWTARLAGREPALDPLAARIPADQHALFLPDLAAAAALLAEAEGDALPVVRLAEPGGLDGGIQARYERQLGASVADLRRSPAAGSIRSIALTGSDPYLPTGTDLAIRFEVGDPAPLVRFLRERLDATGAARLEGEVGGVAYFGARSADRAVCSYVADLGGAVVVTNSPAQLGRIVAAARGETPALAGLPEYRFFRDRYARGAAEESAFLILTDATIRRWCGPRWRIGAARRLRALAELTELQAGLADAVAGDTELPAGPPKALDPASDLGTLRATRAGVVSERYGTVRFLTPIAELPIDAVRKDEADAYNRWRAGYERNWSGVFDPIAVRLGLAAGKLTADVTVMPLIGGSEYRPFLEVVGGAKLAAGAGDPHPEALVQGALALDMQAAVVREGGQSLGSVLGLRQDVALGWIGGAVSAYLDDDPFWEAVAAAERPAELLAERVFQAPIGVHVAVKDPVRLALFLSALRAFVERTAPDLTEWSTLEHGGAKYVRIAEPEGRAMLPGRRLMLFYAATPEALVLSLSEAVVTRFLDRRAREGGEPEPWLGASLALRASRRGFAVLEAAGGDSYRRTARARSWENLPILNEWKRRFPGADPVAVHQALWGVRPVCPAGGRYEWDDRWQTMSSTACGHPAAPKLPAEVPGPLRRVGRAGFGVSFEDDGLRGRAEVELRGEP